MIYWWVFIVIIYYLAYRTGYYVGLKKGYEHSQRVESEIRRLANDKRGNV